MRSAAVAGIAVVVAVTGGVAGHALRPVTEQPPAAASPTRSSSTAPTPPGTGAAWVPTPAPPGLASITLAIAGGAPDISGLTSTDTPTVPVYLLDAHAGHTGDTATIAKALGMTRHESGGTPDRQSVLYTEEQIYDADASLGINRSLLPGPYIVFSDAQRGPGCLTPLRTCTPSTAAAPTGDAAAKQLRRVMTDLGFDTDSFIFQVQSVPGTTPTTQVLALPAVDGRALDQSVLDELGVGYFSGGATWWAMVTADGIVRLEAELYEITKVDTVKTLSPAAAAARATEPGFIGTTFAHWKYWEDRRGSSAPLTAGSAIPWGIHREVATQAAQTWSVRPIADGQSIALPSWRFSNGIDPGGPSGFGDWSTISVPESALRFVSRVEYLPY